jgi:hypothetical protein
MMVQIYELNEYYMKNVSNKFTTNLTGNDIGI